MPHLEDTGYEASVLGLGAMGAAVAEQLVRCGRRVCVWNRSPSRARRLQSLGARRRESAAEALQASPMALVVLANAAAALETLSSARHALAGRTIANFSTGSPEDVQRLRDVVEEGGGRFLQGSILAYPRNIGHPETRLIYHGDAEAFGRHGALLSHLGGHSILLAPEQASAVGAAFLVQCYVSMAGFYEALSLGAAPDPDVRSLARTFVDGVRFFVFDAVEDGLRRIEQGDFRSDQATIDIHYAAFTGMAASLKDRGAHTPIFDAVLKQMSAARMAGHGDEDISALFRVWARDRRAE